MAEFLGTKRVSVNDLGSSLLIKFLEVLPLAGIGLILVALAIIQVRTQNEKVNVVAQISKMLVALFLYIFLLVMSLFALSKGGGYAQLVLAVGILAVFPIGLKEALWLSTKDKDSSDITN